MPRHCDLRSDSHGHASLTRSAHRTCRRTEEQGLEVGSGGVNPQLSTSHGAELQARQREPERPREGARDTEAVS
eukprot:1874620-Rhodomonas_salina.1